MKQKDIHTLITSTTLCVTLAIISAILNKACYDNTESYIVFNVGAIILNIVINLGLSVEIVSINAAKKLVFLGKWIIPITEGVCLVGIIYMLLFPTQNITEATIPVFVGIIFIISGNYFPKNHINPYVGLKFPWLFNDHDSWYKTHKLGSYTWILAGIILIMHPMHGLEYITVPLSLILVAVIPLIYSLSLYFKKKKNNIGGHIMKSSKHHIIIGTVICALTLVVLLAFYNKLPEAVPVHFDTAGNANSYWSRNAVVFGIPVASVLINLIAGFALDKQENKTPIMFYLFPAISFVTTGIMLYLGMK